MTTEHRSVEFLPDYCPRCNPLGHCADSRVRVASLTEPTSVAWRGGRYVVCRYQCDGCGHQWRRADLWDAECAGFDRPNSRSMCPNGVLRLSITRKHAVDRSTQNRPADVD